MVELDPQRPNGGQSVSVVLAVRDGGDHLEGTIDSVLGQTFAGFELVVVDDGSSDPVVSSVLRQRTAADRRIRVIAGRSQGLTAALIIGCDAARGRFVARIDNGDRMSPDRLAKQLEVMLRFPDCSLVTSRTRFYGPEWEHLWCTCSEATLEPVTAFRAQDPNGLAVPISHHGSVMFRASTYRDAGGYRSEFRLGQDWDLWYRLAERGTLFAVPEALYHARLFPNSLSMSHAAAQSWFAALSRAACEARRRGESDAPLLAAARALSVKTASARHHSAQRSGAPGYHFIGEALRRNRDRACRGYLAMAVRKRPWSLRSWVRWVQSLLVPLQPIPPGVEP